MPKGKYVWLASISIFTAIFNIGNDFKTLLELNMGNLFSGGFDNKGVLFYWVVERMSSVGLQGAFIYMISIIIPLVNYWLYDGLVKNKRLSTTLLYFNLVFIGQSFSLLKMAVCQTLFLFALGGRGVYRMVTMLLVPLIHAQGGVVLFTFFSKTNRIFVIGIGLFVSLALMSSDVYSVITSKIIGDYISSEKPAIETQDFNTISILLAAIYLIVSLTTSTVKSDLANKLTPVIDVSLILSMFFWDSPVVSNRILDFIWMPCILYISNCSHLTRSVVIGMFIVAMYSFRVAAVSYQGVWFSP